MQLGIQALLAGRLLLLADDSITIQKVVELTFSDEGVSVVCVNNGKEAIERLDEITPDIVLADVFMPQVNGYELCEYIKQNERLNHIPVMLLVGSFEPFDEAEARRVGADETLTKPFQSIRRLLEKVGILVGAEPAPGEAPTAELPEQDAVAKSEPETLTDSEIEITTADTQPLPPEPGNVAEEFPMPELVSTPEIKMDEPTMETNLAEAGANTAEGADSSEVLLDLGEFEPALASGAQEFVLDLDLGPVAMTQPVETFASSASVSQVQSDWSAMEEESRAAEPVLSESQGTPLPATPTVDQLAKTQEFVRPVFDESPEMETRLTAAEVAEVQSQTEAPAASAPLPSGPLSSEQIDAIAKRVVEVMSDKVVREIAWEVVPQLAELMIKRQLEEKSS